MPFLFLYREGMGKKDIGRSALPYDELLSLEGREGKNQRGGVKGEFYVFAVKRGGEKKGARPRKEEKHILKGGGNMEGGATPS